MDKINTPNGEFVDGTRRVPGTPVPAWWLNQLQDELAAVVSEAGILLDRADSKQLLEAIKVHIKKAGAVAINSIDELRSLNGSAGQVAMVKGYYDGSISGGGMFVADKDDKASEDDGGTVIVGLDGTRWKRLVVGVLSFSDFGILPGKENAGDTLKKINALFKFAYENKIAHVINETPGDYYLNGLILIGDNLTFESVKGVRYLRNTSGAMLYNGLVITAESSREKPCRNISIIGGEFDSNATEQWSAVNFFSLGYINGLTVKDVRFVNCIRNHAIDLSACSNVLIENCKFLGFSKEVSTIYGTTPGFDNDRSFSEAIQIDDNMPGTFTGGSLKGDPCENVTILNNVFSKNPDDTTGLFGQGYGCAVGGHYAARNVIHHNNIIIENNVIADSGYAGIRPFLWDNVKIKGNTFLNCHRNIYIWWLSETNNQSEAGRGYQITGNRFGNSVAEQIFTQMFNNTYTGNYAKLEDVVIAGNTFGNTEWDGALLKLNGVNNCIVSGNLYDTAKRFVDLDYSSKVTITDNSGNTLVNEFFASRNAIYDGVVGETSDVFISNNFAKNSRGGVLLLQKMNNVVVSGNHFLNAANVNNVNAIRASEVNGFVCEENTVLFADSAVNAGVFALDVAANCTNVNIGSFITNAKNVYRNLSSSENGAYFPAAIIKRAEIDSAKVNALTIGADGSGNRNLVVNGSFLASGYGQAQTPPAGENSTRVATTAWVKQENAAVLSASGYQKLPSGLIIQWMTVNAAGATNGSAVLPIAFPSRVLSAVVSDTQDGVSQIHATAWNRSASTTSSIGWNAGGDVGLISIFAIGC